MSSEEEKVSLDLRKETYAKLSAYKNENKINDYSSAIDTLLRIVINPANAKTKRKRNQKSSKLFYAFCLLYRLGLVILGLYLLYQLAFFLFFPMFQVPHHSGEGKRVLFYGDPQIEGSARVKRQGLFGKIQNFYNDCYMKWIFLRTMSLLDPDMVVILGDVVSSQHISFPEFQSRVIRLRWIFALPSGKKDIKFVWLAGNHDIGYGSDCTTKRLKRFEEEFGPQNQYFQHFGHNWLMFNSQVMDGARVEQFHNQTLEFVKHHGEEYLKTKHSENGKPLIVLDHIPLYKPRGNCYDSPKIEKDSDGFIETQTMLSLKSSHIILSYGPTWIFNGHDHNGCYYEHKLNSGIVREMTLRSMMGDYGGFSAILDITEQLNSRENARVDYDYVVHVCGFFTTNNMIFKFIVFLCWFPLALFQLYRILFANSKIKQD